MRSVITFVMGGGRGTRLYPLTKYRAKPAVPLGGKYRLIDIPLSNCINSDINRIYVLTQFLSVSLHRHLRQAYRFDQFSGGFVELLAAQQSMAEGQEEQDWYQGTADAVRKNLRYIEQNDSDHVLILSGDQLYRMDYRKMIDAHRDSDADVTIAALPVDRKDAQHFGIMRIDDSGRVQGFLEKPKTSAETDLVRMEPSWIDARGVQSRGRDCLANMGIYLFKRQTLIDVLTKTNYHDFGKEVFPAAVRSRLVKVYLFDGYWEDIGTIKAFFEANLSLASATPPFQFHLPDEPIYSRARFLPPTLIEDASVKQSLIAEGCRIGKGARIENSVVGLRCVIGENVTIRNSILMGADLYDSVGQGSQRSDGSPPIGIGAGTMIEGAILDKNCRVGRNVHIVNAQRIENSSDSEECVIRDGIPVVVKDAVLRDGWKL